MTSVSVNPLTQRWAEWRSVTQLWIPECNSLTRVNLPFRIRQVMFQLLGATGRVQLFVLTKSMEEDLLSTKDSACLLRVSLFHRGIYVRSYVPLGI